MQLIQLNQRAQEATTPFSQNMHNFSFIKLTTENHHT